MYFLCYSESFEIQKKRQLSAIEKLDFTSMAGRKSSTTLWYYKVLRKGLGTMDNKSVTKWNK
jgi:hypothetical protein